MARFLKSVLSLLICLSLVAGSPSIRKTRQAGLVTCPGFAGYCSESYPGDTCLVVCAFGRNNVPECQTNGKWTDVPRCIEHEPGVPEQIPGICPGIPGYCSLSNTGEVCEFDCITGTDIRSVCTPDGTWDPYPTCAGDVRETKDGCNPCPGPFGGPRNREAEQGQTKSLSNNNNNNNIPAPFRAPASPARNSFNNNNNNNNQFRDPQHQQPARNSNNRRQQPQQPQRQQQQQHRNQDVTVIQPARETPFSPAPQPAFLPNNNNNRQESVRKFQGNNNNNNNFGQKTKSFNQQQPSFRPPQTAAGRLNNNNNHNNNNINRNNSNQVKTVSQARCPGDSLEVCIDVCPSFSARIFGACVAGCARRCPTKK